MLSPPLRIKPIILTAVSLYKIISVVSRILILGYYAINDKEADALYIRLLEGVHEYRVVRLSDDIALDFAAGEKLVGIEVLSASRLFEKPEEPVIDLQSLLPRAVTA